jgi:uncharacterized protein YegL
MKQGYTDIAFVLDRSGSMNAVRMDTIGGFNTFLSEQRKEPGEAKVSLYQFDDVFETVYEVRDLKDAPALTMETFVPGNYTALHDAICYTINKVGARLSLMSEEDRPEKVLIVIITDGLNNASKEFTAREVNAMITHQRDTYHWQFQFIGANQDAIAGGASIGIPVQHSMTYAANSLGTANAFASLNKRVASYRAVPTNDWAGAAASLGFTEEDRKLQEEAGVKDESAKLNEWLSNLRKQDPPK